MASTDSDIALQGMEFWCSVAEIEFNLASGVYDPAHDVVPSSCYAEKALPNKVGMIKKKTLCSVSVPQQCAHYK
jgi:hypothetical protein